MHGAGGPSSGGVGRGSGVRLCGGVFGNFLKFFGIFWKFFGIFFGIFLEFFFKICSKISFFGIVFEFFLEFFWDELLACPRRKILRRGPQSENRRWSRATSHTTHMQASTTKAKKRDEFFRPTLGPHQSEREITKDIQKDILYLISVHVSHMQTSVILLGCSIWCIIHLVH